MGGKGDLSSSTHTKRFRSIPIGLNYLYRRAAQSYSPTRRHSGPGKNVGKCCVSPDSTSIHQHVLPPKKQTDLCCCCCCCCRPSKKSPMPCTAKSTQTNTLSSLPPSLPLHKIPEAARSAKKEAQWRSKCIHTHSQKQEFEKGPAGRRRKEVVDKRHERQGVGMVVEVVGSIGGRGISQTHTWKKVGECRCGLVLLAVVVLDQNTHMSEGKKARRCCCYRCYCCWLRWW